MQSQAGRRGWTPPSADGEEVLNVDPVGEYFQRNSPEGAQGVRPSYQPRPSPRQEPPGKWKFWAGIAAGATAGFYVGWEVVKDLGQALLATIPAKDHPDPNWYLMGAPAAGGVVGAILLGLIGAGIGYSAYRDWMHR